MSALFRPIVLSLLLLCALLPFQNCGQQMTAARNQSSTAGSAQCRAQLKAEALAAGRPASLNCSDFSQYQCERRIFSPDVENMTHFLRECSASGSTCVDVEIHQFSTAEAKNSDEDPSLFAPGGAYNREEIRCTHNRLYEGEGDSLEEALAKAVAACEHAPVEDHP